MLCAELAENTIFKALFVKNWPKFSNDLSNTETHPFYSINFINFCHQTFQHMKYKALLNKEISCISKRALNVRHAAGECLNQFKMSYFTVSFRVVRKSSSPVSVSPEISQFELPAVRVASGLILNVKGWVAPGARLKLDGSTLKPGCDISIFAGEYDLSLEGFLSDKTASIEPPHGSVPRSSSRTISSRPSGFVRARDELLAAVLSAGAQPQT